MMKSRKGTVILAGYCAGDKCAAVSAREGHGEVSLCTFGRNLMKEFLKWQLERLLSICSLGSLSPLRSMKTCPTRVTNFFMLFKK